MCGIAGIVSLDGRPVDATALKRMCDVIAHRGPDDAGYAFFSPGRDDSGRGAAWSAYVDPAFRHGCEHLPVLGGDYCRDELERRRPLLGLGHRRLAVLDLSAGGHQPMCTPDRRLWIVHNGEIYNFPELRDELVARDHVFHTRSDTEVLLRLWEEHGPQCLPMLDGMFAFAIYDVRRNLLTLARDRFGVKPLYYAAVAGSLLFASEAKALLASGLLAPSFHDAALAEYLTFQNVYGRRTIWSDVELLQPGESIRVEPGAARMRSPTRFHDLSAAFDPGFDDEPEAIAEVASGFGAAVRRQLISDVPVGSYLSGGMDSGSIVAVAGLEIDRLHTFTGGFDLTNVSGIEQGFDERGLAERLSYLLQTEHYDVVLHSGDMPAAMDRITWHMDDPRVGMCHQNWYVAKLASRFVKVCLAGTGGDELFAGYPWRYRGAFEFDATGPFDDALFLSWHRLLPPDELRGLVSAELRPSLDAARAAFESVMAAAPPWQREATAAENLLHRALHFEARTFLHGLLVTDDHIAMAHSLETRVPFLDNGLNDLAWRLPPAHKVRMSSMARSFARGDYIDSADGKHVLRRAMESYLDRSFLNQSKQGFSPPDENWYRGPSMDYIKSILYDRAALQRPWFDQAVVRARLEEHFAGRRNHRLLIWSLLSLEWIQRHFVDGGTPAASVPDHRSSVRLGAREG